MPTSNNVSASRMHAVARKLAERAQLAPGKAVGAGDKGPQVRELERALAKVGLFSGEPNASFTDRTAGALKALQKKRGLPVTGRYDDQTRRALKAELTRPLRKNAPKLSVGTSGTAVRALEKELQERGLLKGAADGFFDAQTQAAVKQLERKQGREIDGRIGISEWRTLVGGNGKTGTFTTVNLNIKNNPPMPRDRLMHDIRKAAKGAELIGWNEIAPKSYVDGIRALGREWAHYMPKPGLVQTPISWKKSVFKKVDEGVMKTHGGLAKVSPNRYVTWVKLQHRETGQMIVRMNTHTVAGAWSPKPQSHREWRQESWNTHMEKLRKLIKSFEAKGDTVIVGGDFNRNHFPVLGKLVQYDNSLKVGTHGKSTLDYVMHVPDSSIETVRGGVRKGFHSDHDAVVVKYKLTGK